MCFGRYDSRTHQLADYHPSGSGTIWPGQDYSNPRIKDFMNGMSRIRQSCFLDGRQRV